MTTPVESREGFTSLKSVGAYRLSQVRRILFPIAALSLVIGACSDAGEPSPTTSGPDSTTQTSEPATSLPRGSDGTTTTTEAPGATTALSDRPLAPDFTLELGDGGSYTLSEGAKPVYLVFWAEW